MTQLNINVMKTCEVNNVLIGGLSRCHKHLDCKTAHEAFAVNPYDNRHSTRQSLIVIYFIETIANLFLGYSNSFVTSHLHSDIVDVNTSDAIVLSL
jgi:hypothetical protein